jgi:hypothetical protein
MRWLAAAIALTACERVLQLGDLHPPPDAPPCTMPDVYDDFAPSPMVCGDWGKAYGNQSYLSRAGGALVITPVAGVLDAGQCASSSAFTFGSDGVFVEVSEVETNGGYGAFSANTFTSFTDAKFNASTQLSVQSGFVGFSDITTCNPGPCKYYASGPYVPDQMRWLRMIPTNGGATITAQVSSDGKTWTEYGHRDLTPPALANFVTVALGAGTFDTTGPVGRTVFQHFDVCPN